MRDSAGDGARVRSTRDVAAGRASPCLLGAFLVVGGRRLDRPPAPFRPGGAIETARRSMAEQGRVGVDDVLGDSKRRDPVVLIRSFSNMTVSKSEKPGASIQSRLLCLWSSMQGLVWWSRVCTGSSLRQGWRSEQGFGRVRKRVVNIWSSIAQTTHLPTPAIGGRPASPAPHLSSRPLPAGMTSRLNPSQPRQAGACIAHQALSRGRGALLTTLHPSSLSHRSRGGHRLAPLSCPPINQDIFMV